jgi:hypothetical protein
VPSYHERPGPIRNWARPLSSHSARKIHPSPSESSFLTWHQNYCELIACPYAPTNTTTWPSHPSLEESTPVPHCRPAAGCKPEEKPMSSSSPRRRWSPALLDPTSSLAHSGVHYCLEMATGTNPPGFAIPNPYPWKIFTPIKKPVPMTGLKFCPNPYPSGLRVPTGYPRVFISNMLILFIINKYRND